MESLAEVWKAVVGFEGHYEVSNLGRVRSLDRIVEWRPPYKRIFRGQLLKPRNHSAGYATVNLTGYKQAYVHRLVAAAFIGQPPEGMTDVNHIDGNKRNNRLDNLEYCDRQRNMEHAIANGLSDNSGENNGMAKWTQAHIQRAYDLVASGATIAKAAMVCGMSVESVRMIVRGKRWNLPPLPSKRKRA